jgi:hypothetical protein
MANREGAIRPGYWFRPKRVGFGATPATWQGWVSLLCFIMIVGVVARAGLAPVVKLGILLPLAAGFTLLSWRKTDGGWKWRVGGEDSA